MLPVGQITCNFAKSDLYRSRSMRCCMSTTRPPNAVASFGIQVSSKAARKFMP